ncbi:hypothetical protein GDO78_007639 [Eleutherodactylus coqui]|uniref:Uncharacterized protein n=1 Tax=Eleutherodactylus coqui TaxID=57060 RepID=A0A8J6KD79_ELECQ|nr:hypothetical protein GDO78_007639 [Eleutherodactylus coqui]
MQKLRNFKVLMSILLLWQGKHYNFLFGKVPSHLSKRLPFISLNIFTAERNCPTQYFGNFSQTAVCMQLMFCCCHPHPAVQPGWKKNTLCYKSLFSDKKDSSVD